jgi:hypothetical protein
MKRNMSHFFLKKKTWNMNSMGNSRSRGGAATTPDAFGGD